MKDVDNASRQALIDEIKTLKQERQAVVLGHYYVPGDVQELSDYVGDSLALARKAAALGDDVKVVVMCGVHFMAETVKMLCPDKTVLEPSTEAGCSLADSCPAADFEAFVKAHPGHTVISYVNTSAAVKALTDIVVTSGNARRVIEALPEDEKIIFGPDRNLGDYINRVTGRRMLLWDGACHVHDQFSLQAVINLKKQHPQAVVLVHPECRKSLQMLADTVGSTAVLLRRAVEGPEQEYIVATESGILHEMRRQAPGKTFIPVPPETSEGIGCSCNECAYMKLNTLTALRDCLRDLSHQVTLDPDLAAKARRPIDRMLEMSK